MNNAGTWWLKGAWLELGIGAAVLGVIAHAIRRYRQHTDVRPLRALTHPRSVLARKLETLAFLPLFEQMARPRHLDSYDDAGLGWLTEAPQSYRAVSIERFLRDVTRLRIAQALGQALARCYWRAWYQDDAIADGHVFYLDMHDKVIWTNKPSPVGFVSALHEVRACLKQAFVHGRGGHALFCQTYAADVHLSEVVVEVAHAFEHALGFPVIQVIVTDREGLSREVVQQLARKNKAFVSLLKANQYHSEADFARRGGFRRLRDRHTAQVTHLVADADYQLSSELSVRAALIYDLARPDVLIALIATVSRQQVPDIRRVVGWYLARWNAQENSFRAQVAFVQLNVNFGLRAKRVVPDRHVARQIAELSQHVAAVKHKLESKEGQLAELSARRAKQTQRFNQTLSKLLRPPQRRRTLAAQRARQIEVLNQRQQQRLLKHAARQTALAEQLESHRAEQQQVIQTLSQLDPQATFFEVDSEKDQIVAHLRVALHNSALWARDQYFGLTYRHAVPLSLWRIFFNQDGFYQETASCIVITLNPFRDPRAQREALAACRRFNARRIKTISGKVIEMHLAESI